MRVELRIFKECKYVSVEEPKRFEYEIDGFEVVYGDKAKEIEALTDGSCIDEYHEYLILKFADGSTSTYRNSHVDMHEAR